MTEKYNAFQRFFYSLINREAEARKVWTETGKGHYTVKKNTFDKLQRLALEVVYDTENVGNVSELQREAVAFCLRVNRFLFEEFLHIMHGRYLVANMFYPQCVGEYCYKREALGLTEWTAEFFPTGEEKGTETAGTETTGTDGTGTAGTETGQTTGTGTDGTEGEKEGSETAEGQTTGTDSADSEGFQYSPLSRFFDLYARHICAELTARRAGIHATIGTEGFNEIRAYASVVANSQKITFTLTPRQQSLIEAVAGMYSARVFNTIHRMARTEDLQDFFETILPDSEKGKVKPPPYMARPLTWNDILTGSI